MAFAFQSLEDTPMLRKQLFSLEMAADELRGRCQKLHRGCKRFMVYLGESCDGDIAFADSLESFGSGHDDPLSVALGGPVMSRFTTAFRELGTYKELLHSQVEHMLSNRLLEFINIDLQEAKDSRRQFEKAQYAYDQAREKFMSIKKGTRADVISDLEEELHNSKSAFERRRFNLVSALANIEGKKKFEFLESVSAVMDAHMRYFKQGYELLNQMEPFIHEVLMYSQQYKERTKIEHDNLEKRIQEYRTHEELEHSKSSSNTETPSNGDGIHIVGISPYKGIEALMQSTAKGEVQTIKQGYLFKRSSGLRGDWKKRFFVLDSRGALYYYRNKQGSQTQQSVGTSDHGGGVFSRFRFSHRMSSLQGEDNLSYRSIDLQTSTIKIDVEQSDLRFCFRIISPLKTHTLQAENATERAEWVDKITAVIASLLNSPFLKQLDSQSTGVDSVDYPFDSDPGRASHVKNGTGQQNISEFLRNLPGNDTCAECSSPDPDWASLNLGILLCIECSGVHRNLGVHISKVRSLTLDVKVWEPTMLGLFSLLGNSYCNSIWEELLQGKEQRMGESNELATSITKPGYRDAISIKEKFIQMKYVEKLFVAKETANSGSSAAARIWEAVKTNDIKVAYHLLIASDAGPNTTYDMVDSNNLFHPIDQQNVDSHDNAEKKYDPSNCPKVKDMDGPIDYLQGCSLLHLACHIGEMVMLELLLQFGADINMQDFHGRTPLQHCVLRSKNVLAKYLIKRGASPSIKDYGGQTALEMAMELGSITDDELLPLLSPSEESKYHKIEVNALLQCLQNDQKYFISRHIS